VIFPPSLQPKQVIDLATLEGCMALLTLLHDSGPTGDGTGDLSIKSKALPPLPCNRQYLSCSACLGVKREDNQNCSVLRCVRQLFTMISTLSSSYSSLDWVLSHWVHFTVHRFICVRLYIFFDCICWISLLWSSTVGWSWWDWSLVLRTHRPSVLWNCWLGHLTCKNPSPIWPILCLVGR